MRKTPPSVAWRVDPELVLEALRFYTGKQLKAEQTKLSSTATQLEKLHDGKLSQFLNLEERETIALAAKLVRDLKVRVEHAKDVQIREEKRKEREKQAYFAATAQAVKKWFPDIPTDAEDLPDRLLAIVEIHLGLIHCKHLDDYWTGGKPAHFERDFEKWQSGQHSLRFLVNSSLSEIKRELADHLNYRRSIIPDPNLALKAFLEDAKSAGAQVRTKHPAFFNRLDHLLAIEKSANVERLPVRKKPGDRRL
jgi:hypothetical protein